MNRAAADEMAPEELAEMEAYFEEYEAAQWESEQALWAERGGYASGLARPAGKRAAV